MCMRQAMRQAISPFWRAEPAAANFAIDAILACVPHAAGSACLTRRADGTLREPERRLQPYDPGAALEERLQPGKRMSEAAAKCVASRRVKPENAKSFYTAKQRRESMYGEEEMEV